MIDNNTEQKRNAWVLSSKDHKQECKIYKFHIAGKQGREAPTVFMKNIHINEFKPLLHNISECRKHNVFW